MKFIDNSLDKQLKFFWLSVHPAVDGFWIEIDEKGYSQIDHRTNPVGRGYFGYMVGLLKSIAHNLHFEWNWDAEQSKKYISYKNFQEIQEF